MDLPVVPPIEPMLAKLVREVPTEGDWLYEPKWDGFRCLVFRDGDEIQLQSRNKRPLERYFPEIVPPLLEQLPGRCVVDGELVVPGPDGALDFDSLSQRIHPAESRINRLAAETPSQYVAFDLLAIDDVDARGLPFAERRAALESLLEGAHPPIHLTPVTTDAATALDWFERFEGAGLDGVVAKPSDGVYTEGQRSQQKVKPVRSADCVVAGYRMHKDGEGVGSLLLGLHDEAGKLHHVGVATSFTAARRRELLEEMEPLRVNASVDHPWAEWMTEQAHASTRMPGGLSRWNADKDLDWIPVRCERVAEVAYGQLQAHRFRHATKMLRWRPDRDPASCRYDQLLEVPPRELAELFR